MTKLSDAEITEALRALPNWARSGDEIVRSYQLPTFADAVAFVVRIGFLAEGADHHPDLDLRWRTVKVALSTHSEGGITIKDTALAGEIDRAAGED